MQSPCPARLNRFRPILTRRPPASADHGRVHSLELLLDEATDAAVRAGWRRLLDAELPSQARHTGASNRPHITLALADELPVDTVTAVRAAVGRSLPLPLRLGGLLVFAGPRPVVARLAVASTALLELQAAVVAALKDQAVDPHGQFAPGAWTPHVTLARRLTPEVLGAVLQVAGEEPGDLVGAAVELRQWDMTARVTGTLVTAG